MAAADDDDIEHIYLDDEPKEPETPPSHLHMGHAVDNKEERHKLKRILIGITLVALLLSFIRGIELQRVIADFMAVFFVTFAALKFSDIEAFAHAFRSVDTMAKLIRPWGYTLPFVQAFMGFWYLLTSAPNRLNIFALLVTGATLVGVIQTMRHKPKVQYAYHSKFLRLPIARIIRIETVAMFALAAASLFV